jgi:polygalacturonase
MIIWVDILQQRKLTGKTPIFPFNTDGVDVKGKYVHIYNMTISNYDDSIAVKPSYNNNKYLDGENMNCSEHMLIEDINILYGVGLSIGSVPSSNNYCVQNITFQDIYAKNPLKFIYIKTEKGSKGISTINNIVYKNMTATEPVLWPIYIGPQQQKEPDGTGDGFWPNTNPNVNISNILIDNIYITGTKIQAGLLRCNISNPCKNITLNNVVIRGNYLKNPYFCDDNSIIGKYNNLTSPKPTKNCGFILV